MKKYIIIVSIIISISVFSVIILKNKKIEKYTRNLFYMDTYINVIIYSNNEKKALSMLEEVDNIYKKYHDLTNRYEQNELKNIYYINNNNSKDKEIEINSELYSLLVFGKDWYKKSNHLLNINMGNIIDVWKKYRDKNEGLPTKEEISNARLHNIEDIVLIDKNKIKNNHPNIDLGAIAKGYATEVVGKYLEDNGFDKYIINAGGNVKVGKHYNGEKYKIGIENPNDPSNIYEVIKGENISVVTSGGYQRFYEYDGKRYSHIISPDTLYPSDYMKSVTVVTDDSSMGDALSTTLFLMSVEDGKEYIKDFNNVEVIWFTNDDKIIKTEGIKKYE